jgi:hypothetical protein
MIVAYRWFASSKTRSACGVVRPKLTLAERTHRCDACGLVSDRDVNAAANLAAWGEHTLGPCPCVTRARDRHPGGPSAGGSRHACEGWGQPQPFRSRRRCPTKQEPASHAPASRNTGRSGQERSRQSTILRHLTEIVRGTRVQHGATDKVTRRRPRSAVSTPGAIDDQRHLDDVKPAGQSGVAGRGRRSRVRPGHRRGDTA